MSNLVTDFPTFPNPVGVPAWITTREGEHEGIKLVCFCAESNDGHLFHVDMLVHCLDNAEAIKAAVSNLASAIVNREFPGAYPYVFSRKAEAEAQGKKIPKPDQKYWARLGELVND